MPTESSFTENPDVSDNPYQYCDMEFSFGITKGCSYFPKSDFGLELLDFVKAGSKTGYVCSVNRQFDQQKRICYFTTSAVHKKVDFITQINSTFGSGGLVCSFSDKELTQYISWKKCSFHKDHPDREPKEGVLFLGKQRCGKIWVFSKDIAFDIDGLNTSSHNYVWLKNSISLGGNSKELSLEEISCDIKVSPCNHIFPELLDTLETCLAHNYLSCILIMGAGVMSFHYQEVLKLFRFCPQVMATGPVSTGKSVSIEAALCLFGADNTKNHYLKCSKAFCLQRAAISSLPFGIDDPSFPVDLNEVVVSFYNGTISANVMCGSLLPLTCPIYSSNFTFGKNERISSRALLIPFKNPKVGPSNADQAAAFQKLPDSLEATSSMAGAIVRIEKDLIDGGRTEILEMLNPMLFEVVGVSNPRVVTGCSILLYFTYKMLEHGLDEVRAEELKGRVLQYMTDTVLPSLVAEEDATAKEPAVSAEDDNLFDLFGSALLEGCADLDLDKCSHFIKFLTKRKGEDRPAIAIRFEDIPFDVPLQKEKLTSKIRQMNKKGERDVGENNCAFQFRNGKAKSLVIYLDAFKKSIQDNMINKFQPDLQQKNSKPVNTSLTLTQLKNPPLDEPLLVIQDESQEGNLGIADDSTQDEQITDDPQHLGKEDTNNDSTQKKEVTDDPQCLGKEDTNNDSIQKKEVTDDPQCLGKEDTNNDSTQKKEVTDDSTLDDKVIDDSENGGTNDESTLEDDVVTDNSLCLGSVQVQQRQGRKRKMTTSIPVSPAKRQTRTSLNYIGHWSKDLNSSNPLN